MIKIDLALKKEKEKLAADSVTAKKSENEVPDLGGDLKSENK